MTPVLGNRPVAIGPACCGIMRFDLIPQGTNVAAKAMSIAEHARVARDFLVVSDREFDAGDHRQGSEKLYGAAAQAVIAVCQERGWCFRSHRDMKNAVQRLNDEQLDDGILGGFIAAENFHKNFFHDEMEDYDIAAERPAVHRFVDRMLALLNAEHTG